MTVRTCNRISRACWALPILAASLMGCSHKAHRPKQVTYVTHERVLARLPGEGQAKRLVVSPDGRKIAYIEQRDGYRVVVDGKPGRRYTNIPGLLFSANSRRVGYFAQRGGKWFAVVNGREGRAYEEVRNLRFSPSSRRVAYLASRGGKQFYVVDGREGTKHDQVYAPFTNLYWWGTISYRASRQLPLVCFEGMRTPFDPVEFARAHLPFSPNSRHFAYVTRRGKEWFLVRDGVESQPYDHPLHINGFSPDSRRLAWIAHYGQYWAAVVDGKEGARHLVGGMMPDILFSPDSRYFAYVVREGSVRKPQCFVVIDGRQSPVYSGIGKPVFSPDSRQIAYSARRGARACTVANGREGPWYDMVEAPSFSPDSKRIAYSARKGGKLMVVVDGAESPKYDRIQGLRFSPDSRHLSYIGTKGKLWFVVLDNQEKAHYECIWCDPMVFSADSRHSAYVVSMGPPRYRSFAVIDGKPEPSYDSVRTPVFSPDSRHVAYAARQGKKQFVVVDGHKGPGAEPFYDFGTPIFDDSHHLYTLALRKQQILRMEVEIQPADN